MQLTRGAKLTYSQNLKMEENSPPVTDLSGSTCCSHQNTNAIPGHEVSWNKPSPAEIKHVTGLQCYNTLRRKFS